MTLLHYDVVMIGAGIVGAATAREVQRRFKDASLLLIDKELRVACHQTGRNSGVLHAGVYYAPGSLKARFCRKGAHEWYGLVPGKKVRSGDVAMS